MPQKEVVVDVALVPQLLEKNISGVPCAVIDVLRATTTIITALGNGASRVHPCLNAEEARCCASSLAAGSYLLTGEEKGRRIPGFHLGNSPLEFTSQDIIKDKIILLATTNGTPTLQSVRMKSGLPVYIAALVNLSSACSRIIKTAINCHYNKVLLVCAGQDSRLAAEDVFCAGLMVRNMTGSLANPSVNYKLTDSAFVAREFSQDAKGALKVLSACEHGRYLINMGFGADLEFAAQIDRYDFVPVFDD